METDGDSRCVSAGDGDVVGTALLAEFGRWLDRERGLSAVSVRCYCKQAKAFLTADRRARSGGRLGRGPGHRVHGRPLPGSQYLIGEGDGDVAAGVPAVRCTRPGERPSRWRARSRRWRHGGWPSLPRGMAAAEVERLLAGCDRATLVGGRDYAILSLLARLGLRGAEVAGLQLGDIDWRAGEVAVTGKGSRSIGSRCQPRRGGAWPVADRRPSPLRDAGGVRDRAAAIPAADAGGGPPGHGPGLRPGRAARRGAHRLRHALATEMLRAGASLPRGRAGAAASQSAVHVGLRQGRPERAAAAGAAMAVSGGSRP